MKLLANENFPLASVDVLLNEGYDIKAIGKDYAGILDEQVIEVAIRENRSILTFDRDYGELIFQKGYKPKAGVIYLRWQNFQPQQPGRYLIELFNSGQLSFEGLFSVISNNNIRQKKFL